MHLHGTLVDPTSIYHQLYHPAFAWWLPGAGLVLFGVGLLLVHFGRRTVFGLLFTAFAGLWVLTTTVTLGTSYLRFRRAAVDPTTPSVTGTVVNFVPEPPGGHRDESFDVGDVHFAYSFYTVTGAYNRTAPHGGVLRAGLNVRLRYLPTARGNLIVSIDSLAQ